MKTAGAFTLVAVAVFSATAAFAGPWGKGMGTGYGMSPNTSSELGLTAEQTQKLQTLREAYLKEIAPIRNQFFSKRTELKFLWSELPPNQEKITAKQNAVNALSQQLEEKATRYQLDTHSVLTPEQRAEPVNFGAGRGPGWKRGGTW